jgi:hypothetical protein
MFEDMTKYITEAFAKIFGPREEDMPDIGVQPFECEPYVGESEAKG